MPVAVGFNSSIQLPLCGVQRYTALIRPKILFCFAIHSQAGLTSVDEFSGLLSMEKECEVPVGKSEAEGEGGQSGASDAGDKSTCEKHSGQCEGKGEGEGGEGSQVRNEVMRHLIFMVMGVKPGAQ